MKKVVVFLADGMEECEALIPVDLLRRSGLEVITASVMPDRLEVISSRSISIKADALAPELDYTNVEMLVFPGGLKGSENLAASNWATNRALAFNAAGRYVAAICAAPAVVLAPLGLVEGKSATSYPSFQEMLANHGAKVLNQDVVVDGNIITGRAMGAAMPFALELITLLQGREIARRVAKDVCYIWE